MLLAGKLNEQYAIRLTLQKRIHGFFVDGNAARQIQHRAINQLYRRRAQLHDMLCRIHTIVEARKMADAQSLVFR